MLSFFAQQLAETSREVDLSTDGRSAHVYAGGHEVRVPKDTTRLRVDRSAKHLDGRVDYGRIFSMELPESAIPMDANITTSASTSCLPPSRIVHAVSTMISESKSKTVRADVFKSDGMRHLRNVAFPAGLDERSLPTFGNSSDLGLILPSRRNRSLAFSFLCNGYALRSRFDGLPVHRICYYHSHDSDEVAIRDLREELNQFGARPPRVDCLGMTPLHILACSTKYRLGMFRLLLERYPEYLTTEDGWGDVPLLYALWGRAPREVIRLLAKGMRVDGGDCVPNWGRMVRTLCAATAPVPCFDLLIETYFDLLIETNCDSFPEDTGGLRSLDWGAMVVVLCAEARAPKEHVESFVEMYRTAFPENNIDLQRVATTLIGREKFGCKPFWFKIGISERMSLLEKEEWRDELEGAIRNCPLGSSESNRRERADVLDSLHLKIQKYEVYGPMWLLELALWKARIEASKDDGASRGGDFRSRCRVTCGANIIVPKVVAYLIISD